MSGFWGAVGVLLVVGTGAVGILATQMSQEALSNGPQNVHRTLTELGLVPDGEMVVCMTKWPFVAECQVVVHGRVLTLTCGDICKITTP